MEKSRKIKKYSNTQEKRGQKVCSTYESPPEREKRLKKRTAKGYDVIKQHSGYQKRNLDSFSNWKHCTGLRKVKHLEIHGPNIMHFFGQT